MKAEMSQAGLPAADRCSQLHLQGEAATEGKIRSCGDSEFYEKYSVSEAENTHRVDYKHAAIIHSSVQSVLLSRLLNEWLRCNRYEMIAEQED